MNIFVKKKIHKIQNILFVSFQPWFWYVCIGCFFPSPCLTEWGVWIPCELSSISYLCESYHGRWHDNLEKENGNFLGAGSSFLGKGNGTHSSILAWRIPGTGEPGGLPSMGLHRVGHDWSDLAAAAEFFSPHYLHFFKRPRGRGSLVFKSCGWNFEKT